MEPKAERSDPRQPGTAGAGPRPYEAAGRTPGPFLRRLREDRPLLGVELRPPRTGLTPGESMETWIDMHHAVRGLAGGETPIFLTDNAVGEAEEENLRHLSANLAGNVPAARLVPFLTCKHPLDYCLLYAARAAAHGLGALTVLGGDREVGAPRCVEYSYELRRMIRARHPELDLGGWANPHREVERQAEHMAGGEFHAEFYLAQVVSHHDLAPAERLLEALGRAGASQPGMFGVFLYRSATPAVLERLGRFFPVPAEGIAREFAAGRTPEEVCARTIVALRGIGVDKVYLSNLGTRRPGLRLRQIEQAVQRLEG